MESTDAEHLVIFDTTLRDGEQSPGISLDVAQKLEIARALEALGVDVIEAGFPAASPGEMRAVSAVASSICAASVCALARCHEGDIRAATQALRAAVRPRLHVFIATSPVHRRHKLKMTASQVLARAKESIRLARNECEDVEFSAEDATRTEIEYLCDVVAMAVDAGARTVNIPDTVGYTTPAEYARTIESLCGVLKAHPQAVLSVHCHDDLGMAVANSLSGVGAGARQVECTINGIGERAGNAALEEIVMAVRTRRDRWPLHTSVKTESLVAVSSLVSRHTGFVVPPNKAIVGANAFAHEAGIHQHGMLSNAQTYEIMRAEDVGARTSLVLGKHSGRHAFDGWLRQRGVVLQGDALEEAFQSFKSEADLSARVPEERILSLAKSAHRPSGGWHVADVHYTGGGDAWKLELTLIDCQGHTHRGCGGGTLAAAVAEAVGFATGMSVEVVACGHELRSQGDGTQAHARVEVKVDGSPFAGTAVAPAEVEAVVHALVDALPARSRRMEVKP